MEKKPYYFDREAFKDCDEAAKNKLIALASVHPKYSKYTYEFPRYGKTVDIRVRDEDGVHVGNIEVEVKQVWRGNEFPYSDVQFLPRKKKYWDLPEHHLDQPTMFVMFNEDLSNHLVIKDKTMRNCFESCGKREHSTIASRNEDFYVIPLSEVTFGHFH